MFWKEDFTACSAGGSSADCCHRNSATLAGSPIDLPEEAAMETQCAKNPSGNTVSNLRSKTPKPTKAIHPMKTPIRIVLSAALTSSLPCLLWSQGYFQNGTVRFDNLANTNASLTATSGGLVFALGSYPPAYQLLDYDVNFMLVGGPSLDQMIPIHEWVLQSGGHVFAPTSSAVGISTGGGHFADPSGGVYQIFGVAPGRLARNLRVGWAIYVKSLHGRE